jgi:hypothetical protein
MIIGIAGKIGSGKDTFANFLLERFKANGVPCKIVKFADALKKMASILSGVPVEKFEDQEFKKLMMPEPWGITYRDLLQKIGTECVRNNIHQDAWVLSVDENTKDFVKSGGIVIISDLRFENEYNFCKAGGFTIKIERPGADLQAPQATHISETALNHIENWDFRVVNDKSLGDLNDSTVGIANSILFAHSKV